MCRIGLCHVSYVVYRHRGGGFSMCSVVYGVEGVGLMDSVVAFYQDVGGGGGLLGREHVEQAH
jgi:hypothetical protein